MGGVHNSLGEQRHAYKFLVGRTEGSHCGDVAMSGRIVVLNVKVWAGFNWHEICSSDRWFCTWWWTFCFMKDMEFIAYFVKKGPVSWIWLIPVQSLSAYLHASEHITNKFQHLLEFLWGAYCVKLTLSLYLSEGFNFSNCYMKRLY
jgi:hypothetical protein